jgi:hypothetical protein
LYASADQGVTWAIRGALPVRDAVALGAGATSSDLYLASHGGEVYHSSNAGTSWTAVGAVPVNDVADLVIRPDLSLALLTTSGTLYRSTNNGATFTAMGALTGSNYVSLGLPPTGSALFALARTGEVSRSNNNGATWSTRGAIAVSDAVKLRMAMGKLFALTATGDVYSSADTGVTWIAKGTLSQIGLTSFTSDATRLYAGAGTGEVASSADGGSWAWKGAINQLTVRALGVDTPAAADVGIPTGPAAFAARLHGSNPARARAGLDVAFTLPRGASVGLSVYDARGRLVASMPTQSLGAGDTDVNWNPGLTAAGLYFVRAVSSEGASAAFKLVVLS